MPFHGVDCQRYAAQVREVVMQAFGSGAVRAAVPVFVGVARELVDALLMTAGQPTGGSWCIIGHLSPTTQPDPALP